jgi:membrane-associated phospholipid phosphatase
VTAADETGEAPARLAAWRRTVAHLAGFLAVLGRPRRIAALALPLLPARAPLAIASLLVAVLVAGAMVALDARAFPAPSLLPPAVVETFNEITDFGKSGWVLWPSALALIAIAAALNDRLGRMANGVLMMLAVRFGFVFVAVGLPGLLVAIGKRLIGRVRPSDLGPFAYVPLSWRPDYAGMPSGHAAAAFGAAVAIGALYPRLRLPLLLYALMIAVSRVVVAAHYPSDVIAGAFVGALGALMVRNWFAARRLGFARRADGGIHPLPGPSWRRVKAVAARIAGQ